MPRRSSFYSSPRRRSKADDALFGALFMLLVMAVLFAIKVAWDWIFAARYGQERARRAMIVALVVGAVFFLNGAVAGELNQTTWMVVGGSGIMALILGSIWAWSIRHTAEQRAASLTPQPYMYVSDDAFAARQQIIQDTFAKLSNVGRIWHIEPKNPPIWMIPISAYYLNQRDVVKVRAKTPAGISTNTSVWGLYAQDINLYFLPDTIIFDRRGQCRDILYTSVQVELIDNLFSEREAVSSDTQIIGRTWLHTTVKGLPDLRYKHNPEIPIVLYGVIHLTTTSGDSIYLQISSHHVAQQLSDTLRQLRTQKPCSRMELNVQPVVESSAGMPTIRLSPPD